MVFCSFIGNRYAVTRIYCFKTGSAGTFCPENEQDVKHWTSYTSASQLVKRLASHQKRRLMEKGKELAFAEAYHRWF